KELKFQLQSSKYKVLDLEKKLMDSQLNLVKEKKKLNPLQVRDMKSK
ncbi:cell division protein ZapA, partial [Clostridium botulinum]|nr:cell division protein ZapA [Clostridium botulinum]